MSSCELNDLQVIEEINNGRKEQFRLIMDRYAPVVFHVVRRFEKDEVAVKEMAHEIFLKVYEKLNSFKGDSAFSSWLYMVALNYCRDNSRREQRRNRDTEELNEEIMDNSGSGQDNPESSLINSEMVELLNSSVEQLSPDYALPLTLKYREGLSYEAMSELLNVSVSALKVRIHRARNELKKIMEDRL